MVDSFCHLGSTINSEGTRSQGIYFRLVLGKAAMKFLDLLRFYDVPVPTKIPTVQAMVFPMTFYGSKNWTLKKEGRRVLMLLNFDVGKV